MKFEHILIVSDIDGTLIDANGIPERNLQKLRYFLDNGGLFTLSTGRAHTELDAIAEALGDLARLPFSICNGSALYDVREKKFQHSQYLDTAHLSEAVEFILENFSDKLRLHHIVDETGRHFPEEEGFPNLQNGKFFKIFFWTQAEAIRTIQKAATEQFGEYFTFTISAPRNLELGTGSKAFQFDYLKTHYGAEKIYAIGDYDNDLEMLAAADASACPENATDTVKRVATHRVCSCGDGALADLIELIEQDLDGKGEQHEI